jgi:hypothetical protein
MEAKLSWILVVLGAPLFYLAAQQVDATPTLPAAVAVHPSHAAEVDRIRNHLWAVEMELLAGGVSGLTEAQRQARAGHIRVLGEYRERGIFPHNHDFAGERVPYFVDEHGTLCAMAYLISRSGAKDLVARVANTANNARITDLAGDPELLAWLDEAGLTVAEAQRIQPMYDCCWVGPAPDDDDDISAAHAAATALNTGAAGAAIALNLSAAGSPDAPRWIGAFGVLTGITGIVLGAPLLDNGPAPAALGAVNLAVGMTSLTVSAWNLFRPMGDRADPDPRVVSSGARASVTASPLVSAEGPGSVGVLLRVRF